MRIAIAGASGHVGYITDAMKADDRLSVVAVSPGAPGEPIDGLLATLDRMGQRPEVVDSAEQMSALSGIDVLAAAGPFFRNAQIATAALRRGIPVFCEKPLALTLAELEALRGEQQASGRPICAMLGLRSEPAFAAAKRAMLDGAVGEPMLVTAQKSYKLGSRPDFYRSRATYGGTIPWVGIHALDWCTWLTDRRFIEVSARHTAQSNRDHGDLEMAGAMLLSMEGGAMATVHVDYLRPDDAPTHGDDRVRVAGDRGVLEVRDGRAYCLPQGECPLEATPNLFALFAASLRGECQSPVSTQDSFYATAAALIAREAADTGRTLRFADYGW